MAREGLRTLVVGKKQLTMDQFTAFDVSWYLLISSFDHVMCRLDINKLNSVYLTGKHQQHQLLSHWKITWSFCVLLELRIVYRYRLANTVYHLNISRLTLDPH